MSTAYRLLKHTSPSPGWGRDKGWGQLLRVIPEVVELTL